jgi:hypothetical protein
MPMGLSAGGSNGQGMAVAGWSPLVLSAETFQAVSGGDIDTPHGLYITRDPLRDSPIILINSFMFSPIYSSVTTPS